MTEWGVIGVIVVLVSLVATLVKPMLSLNTAIVRLTTLMDGMSSDLRDLTSKNAQSHERIFDKLDEHGDKIADHEHRIADLEHKHES